MENLIFEKTPLAEVRSSSEAVDPRPKWTVEDEIRSKGPPYPLGSALWQLREYSVVWMPESMIKSRGGEMKDLHDSLRPRGWYHS